MEDAHFDMISDIFFFFKKKKKEKMKILSDNTTSCETKHIINFSFLLISLQDLLAQKEMTEAELKVC